MQVSRLYPQSTFCSSVFQQLQHMKSASTYSKELLFLTHKLEVSIQHLLCSGVAVVAASENVVAGARAVPQQWLSPADHTHSREAEEDGVHFHLAS